MFVNNLSGKLGLSLFFIALFSKSNVRLKGIILFSVALGILPLFLFTNLHIVHDYYQSANIIFLIFAVAVALGGIIIPAIGAMTIIPMLALILISNYVALFKVYMPSMTLSFTKESRDLAIGDILKRELPKESQFVAFGNDWSSSFAYISERKSFTVPHFFKEYDTAISHPENFLEKNRLGAVVACSNERPYKPDLAELIKWLSHKQAWKLSETHGCYITTPEKTIGEDELDDIQCQGHFDRAEIEARNGVNIISFSGWIKPFDTQNIFVTLSKIGNKPLYFEALKVPRLDANAYLNISNEIDLGFSRIIPNNLAPGEYDVGIIQSNGKQKSACQFHKKIIIPG
ncbi:MAG: hypothetical protein QNK11_08415 [Legionella sp.]|nr:hypothetical protein [Legionella sp.]